MPKISIIIPVYNVEKYIHQSVSSAINQTLTDIEIILVDDGSSDNCPAICDKFANDDKRVVVIHQKNKGLGGARNTGIEIAKGKYILFLDSDDWITIDCCEKMYNIAIRNNVDIVLSGEVLFFDDSNTYSDGWRDYSEKIGKIEQINNRNYVNCFTPAWGRLYKRTFIKNNKLKFVERCFYEDNSWGCLIAGLTNKVAFAGNFFYYRQRAGSITNRKDGKVLDWVRDFLFFQSQLKNINISDIKLKWAYQWYILNLYNYFYQLDTFYRHVFFSYIVNNFNDVKLQKIDFFKNNISHNLRKELYGFYKCIKNKRYPNPYIKIKLFGIIPLKVEYIEERL